MKPISIKNTYESEGISFETITETYEVPKKGLLNWFFGITETKTYKRNEALLKLPSIETFFAESAKTKEFQEITRQIVIEILSLVTDFLNQNKNRLKEIINEYEKAIKGSVEDVTNHVREKNKQLAQYKKDIEEIRVNNIKTIMDKDSHE